jgi:exodeoxyribonuclease VII small subunit
MTDSTSLFSGKEKAPKNFEDALQELEELVANLESGDVPLEDSLKAFERGQKLLKFCETKLAKAEQVLKQLSQNGGNTPPS